MELPRRLREAVDEALAGVAAADLARAARTLSQRYRAETRDGALHLGDDTAARAYLATRLPATYAVIRAGMAAVADARPDFAPHTLLDVGAGPARRCGRQANAGQASRTPSSSRGARRSAPAASGWPPRRRSGA